MKCIRIAKQTCATCTRVRVERAMSECTVGSALRRVLEICTSASPHKRGTGEEAALQGLVDQRSGLYEHSQKQEHYDRASEDKTPTTQCSRDIQERKRRIDERVDCHASHTVAPFRAKTCDEGKKPKSRRTPSWPRSKEISEKKFLT